MEFEKALQHIVECWQIKMLASGGLACLTFLFGEMSAAFFALWVLVVLDLLSRWACITKKYITDNGGNLHWYRAFIGAWQDGILNSHEMRYKFFPKIGMYLAILAAAHMVSFMIPNRVFLSMNISAMPDTIISIYLGLTEFLSINENFVCMGYQFLAPLSRFAATKREALIGETSQDGEVKNK